MRRNVTSAAAMVLFIGSFPAHAWWNGGHMLVAYIAYQKLDRATRARVDRLLQLNPMYAEWIRNEPKSRRGLVAFERAATWADCIKRSSCSPGYQDDRSDTPQSAQNTGYSDHLMHKYWHFIDLPYSAGAPGQPPATPNALTEIELLRRAISSGESDEIESYDVVWLEHLVGDVHQPLHCTSRFTVNHPDGDRGGNLVVFCEKPCSENLHAFWDGLLGDQPKLAEVEARGRRLLKRPKPEGANVSDPEVWVQRGAELAKLDVYAAPIGSDNDPESKISPSPDQTYKAKAIAVAELQALLAGYRLAALLNEADLSNESVSH